MSPNRDMNQLRTSCYINRVVSGWELWTAAPHRAPLYLGSTSSSSSHLGSGGLPASAPKVRIGMSHSRWPRVDLENNMFSRSPPADTRTEAARPYILGMI